MIQRIINWLKYVFSSQGSDGVDPSKYGKGK